MKKALKYSVSLQKKKKHNKDRVCRLTVSIGFYIDNTIIIFISLFINRKFFKFIDYYVLWALTTFVLRKYIRPVR